MVILKANDDWLKWLKNWFQTVKYGPHMVLLSQVQMQMSHHTVCTFYRQFLVPNTRF